MNEGSIRGELEGYLRERDMNEYFTSIIESCLMSQPENPSLHVMKYLFKNYPTQVPPTVGAALDAYVRAEAAKALHAAPASSGGGGDDVRAGSSSSQRSASGALSLAESQSATTVGGGGSASAAALAGPKGSGVPMPEAASSAVAAAGFGDRPPLDEDIHGGDVGSRAVDVRRHTPPRARLEAPLRRNAWSGGSARGVKGLARQARGASPDLAGVWIDRRGLPW